MGGGSVDHHFAPRRVDSLELTRIEKNPLAGKNVEG
jgi:hypothetical protein